MKPLSKTAQAIRPSATMAIDTQVKKLRAEGVTVYSFGSGEPDFMTPENVRLAGIRAIETGHTKYTPAAGMPGLRRAIAERIKADDGIDYTSEQIIIAGGGKHIVYVTLRVLLDEGDEAVIPAPYWVSYPEMVCMAGGTPVIVTTDREAQFKLTAAQLEAAITPKTKVLILNNPGNPTGSVYTAQELAALAEVCRAHDIYILSDEIYAKLVYDGAKFASVPSVTPDAYERTVLVNGVSKAYAMTGWRIGYAAAPTEIAKAMGRFLSHSTGSPATMSQIAAIEAFSGPQDQVEVMRRAYDERRLYLVSRIRAMDGLDCIPPQGAFYLLINVEKQYGRTLGGRLIENDMDFAEALLDTVRVAVTPGSAFGAPGYVRWCYASSMEELKAGLDLMEQFIK